jgi:hypothetical protein
MHVAVKDTTGITVHVYTVFEVVETGMNDYILVVDDYDHRETLPVWGLDEERDAFYSEMLAPFGWSYQWDPHEHLEAGVRMPPDVETLAGASSVVWYCDDGDATIGDLLGQYGARYDVLGGYIRTGGNLLLCGWKTLAQVAGSSYPIDPGPSDTSPGEIFMMDILRIGSVDNSGEGANPNIPWDYGYCMHGAVPTSEGEGLGFEPAYIDSGQCPDDPGKWFAYCQPPAPQYSHCGLNVEKVYPYGGEALELFTVDSYLNSEYEGVPCATLYLSGTNKGNVCYLGFPLYYLQTPQAEALVRRVLTLFGEEER